MNRTLAASITWLAFMAGLFVGGEIHDPASFAIGGGVGVALVAVGFAAMSHCRPPVGLQTGPPARLVLLSLAIGAGMGLGNLGANWLIAAASPTLRALLTGRFVALRPLDALVAAPIVEEVVLRLFLMSALAWVVSRFTKRGAVVFGVALVASAFVFATLHLNRPLPADPELAHYYRLALVTKYTLAGLPLGWIFWRWGLPYAIVGHAAANAAHLALQPIIF